jgi:hypothetical protein
MRTVLATTVLADVAAGPGADRRDTTSDAKTADDDGRAGRDRG